MERIKLVVTLPVGPTCRLDCVQDTIDSILYFTTPSRKIIILDDSGKDSGKKLSAFPDVVVLKTPRNYGIDAGLYLSLSMGYEFAHKNYDFDVILRMDSDALVIGKEPEEDALTFFRQNPHIGIIGSYKIDCNGEPRDYSWAGRQLRNEISLKSLLRFPHRLRGILFLRRMVKGSVCNGYDFGEHCLGGAYFVSGECISALYEHNLLSRTEIYWSRLQEDHIFGLLINSLGFKHADFATGSLPMGLGHRGLPCPPEELVARGKKVTHSTRFYGKTTEEEIREFFRRQRSKEAPSGGVSVWRGQ